MHICGGNTIFATAFDMWMGWVLSISPLKEIKV